METLFRLGFFLSALLLIPLPTQSAVCSIDLGSEWFKVAVVNIQRGQSPISIAINEMSKRKSPALVAFHSGDRLLAEEAAGLAARYPEKVYSHVRNVLGKPLDYTKRYFDSLYLPLDLVEDSRGVTDFRIDDGVTVYSAEELVAMILGYALNLAEFHSKLSVKDAVISVPPYFGQAERKAILAAAKLAGVNVLSLINEHAGAALQYGIDKDFANDSRYVIFYDMGASSTYASLVHFLAYTAKEYGKKVSVNQFQVKDVRWDHDLGGQNMEQQLAEYFADEFNKQIGGGVDLRKSAKAMAKLKKQVKRTKEILSANTVAPISVESIYEDRDFRSTITREKFEELCDDLWEKSLLPVKELLKHSGFKADEIYAVELIGGATRVPKLQSKLQEFLGRKDLDKHLDADEAIVRGGALHSANLSDGIKMNRKLGMIDGSPYGLIIELDGPDLLKDENAKQLIVPRMKKLPSKMFRSIIHNKDFDVSLAYESAGLLPPGVSSPIFAQYAIIGLADASEKYLSRNVSSPIKANLHFSLCRSGILSLERADAVIEISEWVEVFKQSNLTVDSSSMAASLNISLETVAQNTSGESSSGLQLDGENGKSNSSLPKQNASDVVTEKRLKKRTFRIPLKIIDKTVGPAMCLSKESIAEAKRKLEALDEKDTERRRTAELKNSLEGYIYATKGKLETMDLLAKVSTDEEHKSFTEKLNEVQEWLYTDGEDAAATEFQERFDLLKAIGDPIFFRLNELTARPTALEHARQSLDKVREIAAEWEVKKPWLPKDRIDEVVSDAEKLRNWLHEKEGEQKKTSGFDKPVFTSEEVYGKVFDIQDKVGEINKIPKPKPKAEKAAANETDKAPDEVYEIPMPKPEAEKAAANETDRAPDEVYEIPMPKPEAEKAAANETDRAPDEVYEIPMPKPEAEKAAANETDKAPDEVDEAAPTDSSPVEDGGRHEEL